MPYISVNNFKFGLDTRRSELTAAPGSLLQALNGHVTQGGEFEQRKAFVKYGGADLPATCFGFEVIAIGNVVFGSVVTPTLPTGVSYIRCQHPTDSTKSMSAVLCSCCFGGKAFCAVQFNSGAETYLYYDGTVIPGSIAGIIFTSTTYSGTYSGSIVSDGILVTIGTQTYRFKTTIAQAYDINIGAGAPDSANALANLVKAINGTGVAGTDWYGTAAGGASGVITSTVVTAVLTSTHLVTVTAIAAGPGGSVIPTTTTSASLLWSGTTLSIATQSTQTAAQIAQQMYNLMLGSAWNTAGVFVENLHGASFNIYTKYQTSWKPVIDIGGNTGTGTLLAALLSTSTEPIVGSNGAAGLTLFAGTTGSISSLKCLVSSTTYNLTTAAVAFITNVSTTAAALSTAINNQKTAPLSANASSSTNSVSITTDLALASNFLQIAFTAGANLCFENMSLDFSGVPSGTSIKNIYVSDNTNLLATQKYGTGGTLYASPSGGLTGHQSFTLAYGTYLWIPGLNDTSIGVTGVNYFAVNYPKGVVVTFDATAPGYVVFSGKGSQLVSGQLILLTDILANAGISYTGAASLTTIAAAITTHAAVTTNGTSVKFVASNTGVSASAGTTMWISRNYIGTQAAGLAINAINYSGLYFYSNIPGVVPLGFSAATPPTSYGFGSSVNAVSGRGPTYKITFGGTWASGDKYLFDIVTAATTFKSGIGHLTRIIPVACLTLNDRVHLIEGTNWLGCDNGDPTQWEEQAPGAFKISTSNQLQTPENLTALAPYQGQISLFSPNTVQIWSLNADPDLIAITQVLANIGCIAPLSAQPLGELDVVFLHSSGIRSLRARVASLNAYTTDIGAPVDELISGPSGFLKSLTSAQIAAACAIVEPNQNRYWLYIPPISTGTADVLAARMFVLSYFPSNKIVAWSEYTAAPSSAFDSFIPKKLVVLNSQVYIRAAGVTGTLDAMYVFGGTDNITYDDTQAILQIPFYDEQKPGHQKFARAFDSDLQGTWNAYGSPNWIAGTNQTIGQFSRATFDDGIIPYYDVGTHFSFTMTSVNNVAHPTVVPTITSFIFYYELGSQPV